MHLKTTQMKTFGALILVGFFLESGLSWGAVQPGISGVSISQGVNNAFDIDGNATLDFGFQTTDGSQSRGNVEMGLDVGGVGVYATNVPFAFPLAFADGIDSIDNSSPIHYSTVSLVGNGSPLDGGTNIIGVKFLRANQHHIASLKLDFTVGGGNGTLIESFWNDIPQCGFTAGTTNANPGTIPVVISMDRVGPEITTATNVSWIVEFSEAVQNVGDDDFQMDTGGTVSFDSINVQGSGNSFTVTVSTIIGTGLLRLNVIDNNTIQAADDAAILAGPVAGTGNFIGDIIYIDPVPTVFSITRLDSNPVTGTVVRFRITFSEPVDSVDITDFVSDGSANGISI